MSLLVQDGSGARLLAPASLLLIALGSPGATTPHSLGSGLINRFFVDVKRHDIG